MKFDPLDLDDESSVSLLPGDAPTCMLFNWGPSRAHVRLGDEDVTADDATTTTLLVPGIAVRFHIGGQTHIAARADDAGGAATLGLCMV